MRLLPITFALALVISACADREPTTAPPTPVPVTPPAQGAAYLSVSDLSPDAGDTIVVTGSIAIGDSMSVASFRVRLSYDRHTLTYLDAVQLPGMMRVVNPRTDDVVVAGASADASSDGRFFAVRFRVEAPASLKSLALSIDELNDAGYVSRLASVQSVSNLRRDRRLSAGKIGSR